MKNIILITVLLHTSSFLYSQVNQDDQLIECVKNRQSEANCISIVRIIQARLINDKTLSHNYVYSLIYVLKDDNNSNLKREAEIAFSMLSIDDNVLDKLSLMVSDPDIAIQKKAFKILLDKVFERGCSSPNVSILTKNDRKQNLINRVINRNSFDDDLVYGFNVSNCPNEISKKYRNLSSLILYEKALNYIYRFDLFKHEVSSIQYPISPYTNQVMWSNSVLHKIHYNWHINYQEFEKITKYVQEKGNDLAVELLMYLIQNIVKPHSLYHLSGSSLRNATDWPRIYTGNLWTDIVSKPSGYFLKSIQSDFEGNSTKLKQTYAQIDTLVFNGLTRLHSYENSRSTIFYENALILGSFVAFADYSHTISSNDFAQIIQTLKEKYQNSPGSRPSSQLLNTFDQIISRLRSRPF